MKKVEKNVQIILMTPGPAGSGGGDCVSVLVSGSADSVLSCD